MFTPNDKLNFERKQGSANHIWSWSHGSQNNWIIRRTIFTKKTVKYCVTEKLPHLRVISIQGDLSLKIPRDHVTMQIYASHLKINLHVFKTLIFLTIAFECESYSGFFNLGWKCF